MQSFHICKGMQGPNPLQEIAPHLQESGCGPINHWRACLLIQCEGLICKCFTSYAMSSGWLVATMGPGYDSGFGAEKKCCNSIVTLMRDDVLQKRGSPEMAEQIVIVEKEPLCQSKVARANSDCGMKYRAL